MQQSLNSIQDSGILSTQNNDVQHMHILPKLRILFELWHKVTQCQVKNLFLRYTFKCIKVSGMLLQFKFIVHYSKLNGKWTQYISNLRERDWGYNLDLHCSCWRWEEGDLCELSSSVADWANIQSLGTISGGVTQIIKKKYYGTLLKCEFTLDCLTATCVASRYIFRSDR